MQHAEYDVPVCQQCNEFDEDLVFDQINRSYGSHLSDPGYYVRK